MRKLIIISLLLCSCVNFIDAKKPYNYYANKAEESISNQRFEDALDYARQEITDYADNPNGYLQASFSLYALDKPGQSLSMVDKAIEKSKKNKEFAPRCFLFKSSLLKEMGDSVQSIAALNDGLKIDGNNVDLLIERALRLINSDKKSALKDLQKVKKLAPDNPQGYAYTAYIYTTESNYNDALDEITRSIALDNTEPYNYGLRGLILKQLGQSPDWIRDCLKNYELDPEATFGVGLLANADSPDTREQIINEIEQKRTTTNGLYQLEADLLYTWGIPILAGKVYEEMINLGMDSADTYTSLADCQQSSGFLMDAYITVSNGLDKYPDNFGLKFLKAQIGVTAGKAADVMDILNSLINQSPEEAAIYTEKGKAFMSLGKFSEAIEPFETAVKLNSSAINKLYLADAVKLSGHPAKANPIYNEILHLGENAIAEENVQPQYVYAMAYSGMGNRNEAISAIKLLSREIPDAELTYMPVIYSRLGLKSEAIGALKNYASKKTWSAFLDLYSYEFFNLHTEPEFAKLLSENGVKTQFNKSTQLLEYMPEKPFQSAGGTSINEVMNLMTSNLSDWEKEFNKLCPIDIGMGGQIVSVKFDPKTNTIIYNCVTIPETFNYNRFNNNPSYKRKQEDLIALSLISQNPDIANTKISVKYNYKASDNSGNATFVITPSRMLELKRKYKSQDEIDKLMLDFWVEEENLTFAENPGIAPGTIAKLEGSTLTYILPTSEEDGSMAQIELFKSDVKNQLANIFKDPSMIGRIPVLVRKNITFKFSYIGNTTGKTVDIIFTPEELSKFKIH